MKILILDNYDSFTYNLVHLVEKILHEKVDVFRNDEITVDRIEPYDKIILSPGPGLPSEAGIMPDVIDAFAPTKSILGVCLGHQAIAEAFGGRLLNLPIVYHGIATPVTIENDCTSNLFYGLPRQINVGRYHSWVVADDHLPGEFEVTARDENNIIMALSHTSYDVQGVQFHPESILTPDGEQILRNWLT